MILPDKVVSGLILTKGRLVGLTNLVRSGEAFLEERQDKVFLTFSLMVRNIRGEYTWARRKLRFTVWYILTSRRLSSIVGVISQPLWQLPVSGLN